MNMRRIFCSGFWAAALMPSFGAGAAPSAGETASPAQLAPVTIEAPVVRHDVRTACPAIDGALQTMLGPAWGRIGQAGTMRVQFHVENQRVTQVTSVGLSSDYRPYVRKAVSKLDCHVATSAPQDFRFLLVIRDPDDTSPSASSDRVALLADD